MEDTTGLEKDRHGNLVVRPVTGWTIGTAFEMGVLVAIQYVENPEQLKTGNGRSIQLVLTPNQAVELAEVLKRKAAIILEGLPTQKPS
jgi:hypothetical protein